MARRGGGCLGGLLLLVLLAGAAWYFRDRLPGPWAKPAPPMEVSEEAADSAQAKLERLRAQREEVRLSDVEFTSLLRYRMQGLAADLETPSVTFADSTLRLRGRFPTDRLPDTEEVNRIRTFLPDTAEVVVRGSIRTVEPGRAAVRVDNASFARIPIPAGEIPGVLERMGRGDQPGLAPEEYPFPLPPGVGSARVENGQLVLSPREGQQ